MAIEYQCSECGKSYSSQKGGRSHIIKYHNEKSTELRKISKDDADKLRQIAYDKKFVNCDICKIKFLSRKGKWAHDTVKHQGIRFKCLVCGKQFSRKERCKKHLSNFHENSEGKFEKIIILQ